MICHYNQGLNRLAISRLALKVEQIGHFECYLGT